MKKLFDDRNLLEMKSDVNISLYQATARTGEDVNLGPIEFKNLMKQVKAEIGDTKEGKVLLEKLSEIQEDPLFWQHRTEGLLLLLNDKEQVVHNLAMSVKSKVVVGGPFHLLPLIQSEQNLEEHFILDIGKDRFQLWFGNGTSLYEIKGEIAASFDELYNDLDANADVNFGSYSGTRTAFHGHRSKSEEEEKNKEKYFRYLDDTLSEFFDRYGFKVFIGGTTENIADWKSKVSASYYIEEDLGKPVSDFSQEDLKNRIVEIFSAMKKKEIEEDVSSLFLALRDNRGTSDLQEIREELDKGRIEKLFVNSKYLHMGQVAEVDSIIERAVSNRVKVVIVPEDKEEFEFNLATTYRY